VPFLEGKKQHTLFGRNAWMKEKGRFPGDIFQKKNWQSKRKGNHRYPEADGVFTMHTKKAL